MGIIIFNDDGQLLWAKRLGQDAWQFPQGGVQQDESPEQAVLRELNEEVGLEPGDDGGPLGGGVDPDPAVLVVDLCAVRWAR